MSIDDWVQTGVAELYDLLPDFGKVLALDGKILETYATPYGKKKKGDRRSDLEADFTKKEKRHKDGTVTIERYYGYRAHLIVDSTYELPVLWEATPVSHGEPTVVKRMVKNLSAKTLDRAQYLTADRGYSGAPLQNLLEDADIIPIIDNPHKWKEDETRQYLDTDLIYNQSGEVIW